MIKMKTQLIFAAVVLGIVSLFGNPVDFLKDIADLVFSPMGILVIVVLSLIHESEKTEERIAKLEEECNPTLT